MLQRSTRPDRWQPHAPQTGQVRHWYALSLQVAQVSLNRSSLGVSPRGATALLHASKAWAWLAGLDYVTPDEVKAIVKPTLRHRVRSRQHDQLGLRVAGREAGRRAGPLAATDRRPRVHGVALAHGRSMEPRAPCSVGV